MTANVRLARLERLAATRTPEPPPRWATLGDVPTIRWADPAAVEMLADDWEAVTAHANAIDAADLATAAQVADASHDAARRIAAAIPRPDQTPEEWQSRLDRLPEGCPSYVNSEAAW